VSRTDKKTSKYRVADLVVLLVLASLVILYGIDAYDASSEVLNLILVIPVIAIVLVLCLIQFVIEIRDVTTEAPARESVGDVAPVIGLFAAYVLTLQWLGFDIGTMLFVAAFLWVQGERRWHWLVGYSISLGFGLALFFSTMLPYPMPMLILQSAY
jgi:putative tricarboxylic transport membrane protein